MKKVLLNVLFVFCLIRLTEAQTISSNGTTLTNTTSAGAGTAWTTTFPSTAFNFSAIAT
jgi:hypothetical protein